MIFGCCYEGLWQQGLLAEVGGNLVLEWLGGGGGLPLSTGMGCAAPPPCPCGRPKIHGDRTRVAYSMYVEKPQLHCPPCPPSPRAFSSPTLSSVDVLV